LIGRTDKPTCSGEYHTCGQEKLLIVYKFWGNTLHRNQQIVLQQPESVLLACRQARHQHQTAFECHQVVVIYCVTTVIDPGHVQALKLFCLDHATEDSAAAKCVVMHKYRLDRKPFVSRGGHSQRPFCYGNRRTVTVSDTVTPYIQTPSRDDFLHPLPRSDGCARICEP